MAEVNYSQKAITEPMGLLAFKLIYTGESNYVTGIASDLGTNKQTVNNYLKGLEEQNFIEPKDTDDRRNRYQANPDLLVHRRMDQAKKTLEDHRGISEDESIIEMYDQTISQFEEHEQKIKTFSEDYLVQVLEKYTVQELSDMSISEVLIQEFTFSAMDIYLRGDDELDIEELRSLEWFNTLYSTLMLTNIQGQTRPIMKDLLKQELDG